MFSIVVNIVTVAGQPLRVAIDTDKVQVLPAQTDDPYITIPAAEAKKLMQGLDDVYNHKS